MKTNRLATLLVLLTANLLFSGPQSAHATETPVKFQEADAASVVLRYSGWEEIEVSKPKQRARHGKARISPKEFAQVFKQLDVKRNMAVVVLQLEPGFQRVNELVSEWNAILGRYGFKRVVCLHAGARNQIQGLLVIADTALSDQDRDHTASL